MSRVTDLHRGRTLDHVLNEYPWARQLAEDLAYWEEQLGEEVMGLILEFFEAEDEASSPADPRLLEVVAKIEAFERSRGRPIDPEA